ncbi:MAG: acyl-CoA/acyl-ACP dehydrogenase [Cuniculiplasma sp.]|nr:acyl-CoA/acyl-ACP dehydrogenase [Cuniculiplasma sp.]
MLDYTFTEEQELLRTTVREFCNREIKPRIKEMIKNRRIPSEIIKGMGELGILGMTIPEKYGGPGYDAVTVGIVAEEIGRSDPTVSIPVFFLVDNAWSYLISKYGSEKLKNEYLPDVAKGKKIIGIASTEPNFGSDVASMTTVAKKISRGYVVNGEKSYISLVRDIKEMGGGYVTVTKTAPEKPGTSGTSLIFLPYSQEHFDITYLEEMGREGSSWGAFRIKDYEVPEHYLIGKENEGFKIIHEGFEFARALISVISAGTALESINRGIDYMKQRVAFGKSLTKFQGLQFQVADNVAKMETALDMGYRALWVYDQEQKYHKFTRFQVSKEIAKAKLLSTTWGFDAVNDALQWQGAFGYSTDCPEEYSLRGIRSFQLAEGSREIMKQIIARESIGKEFI